MKKKWLLVFIAVFMVLAYPGINAYADMGPKPSVTISFYGLEGKSYYVTLLSKTSSTGPWSVDGEPYGDVSEEIAQKFRQYQDPDGFYFLNYYKLCEENDIFEWTYHPPQEFKILLYFPDEDRFLASKSSYERYAFDSYFKVEVSSGAIAIEEGQVVKNYDYLNEALEFLMRVAVTLAIEIGLALLLKYNKKEYLKVIGFTNLGTQTFLSAAVVLSTYFHGALSSIFFLPALEIIVFIAEATVYSIFFKKINPDKNSHPIAFSFIANLLSFIAGLFIYRLF
jgi:hypothetical protein